MTIGADAFKFSSRADFIRLLIDAGHELIFFGVEGMKVRGIDPNCVIYDDIQCAPMSQPLQKRHGPALKGKGGKIKRW